MKSSPVKLLCEIFRDLGSIKKLPRPEIPQEYMEEIEECLGKLIFWDHYGSCRVGKLVGVVRTYEYKETFYFLVNYRGIEIRLPIWKSITRI